jgi:hypothetical protein
MDIAGQIMDIIPEQFQEFIQDSGAYKLQNVCFTYYSFSGKKYNFDLYMLSSGDISKECW